MGAMNIAGLGLDWLYAGKSQKTIMVLFQQNRNRVKELPFIFLSLFDKTYAGIDISAFRLSIYFHGFIVVYLDSLLYLLRHNF